MVKAQCSRCQNFTMKAQPLKHLGLYQCPKMEKWEYPNPFCDRDCKKFEQVKPEDMAARLAFEQSEVPDRLIDEAKAKT